VEAACPQVVLAAAEIRIYLQARIDGFRLCQSLDLGLPDSSVVAGKEDKSIKSILCSSDAIERFENAANAPAEFMNPVA
jgi:hypothetical protein